MEPVRKHIVANGIQTERCDWGQPTLVIRDMDANELFLCDLLDKEMLVLEPSGTTEPMVA